MPPRIARRTGFEIVFMFGCLLTTVLRFSVPGYGAEETEPAADLPAVTAPPAELRASDFYTKYIDANGYPILASSQVNDYALREAAYLVDRMLASRPDVKSAMVASGSRLVILAHNEFTTDLPEFSHFKPKDFWDARARGTGGSRTDPYCSCGEENLLGYPGDPYSSECILIHEFAHNIHLRGMVSVDPTFDARLIRCYEAAMDAGLWQGKYASVNHHEYFAEGVQSWFNNNRPPDHDHNHVNTRAELKEYDPGLAALCEEVFRDTELVYTKPATRLNGHLAGYDPRHAPTFRWPERLADVKRSIRENARRRGQQGRSGPRQPLAYVRVEKKHCPNSKEAGPSTTVLFDNQSDRAVTVYWVDTTGDRHEYARLDPGQLHRQSTYAGHSWLIADAEDREIGHFVAAAEAGRAVVPGDD